VARTNARPSASEKRGNLLFVVIGLGAVGVLLLLCFVGGGVGLYFAAFREQRPADGAGPAAKNKGGDPAGPVHVSKDHLHKLEAGMTVAEVQDVLGAGKTADEDDLVTAFGEANRGADVWSARGRDVGVTAWRQWQDGDSSIFVGFGKGARSGKERALVSFLVKRDLRGFRIETGMFPLGGADPDDLAERREERAKLLNHPKWKAGNPKDLLVGKWRVAGRTGYDFNADGTYAKAGDFTYSSTYRFLAADQIELTIPAGKVFVGGKETTEKYQVLVSQEELILMPWPGRALLLEYQRVQ
jgi:hypothetical protein